MPKWVVYLDLYYSPVCRQAGYTDYGTDLPAGGKLHSAICEVENKTCNTFLTAM